MSADALATALATLGLPCTVEAEGRLAVIRVARGAADVRDDELRRRALELLPAHGFAALALELPADAPRASLRRD